MPKMKATQTIRNFGIVKYPIYPTGENTRLVQESSAIGGYVDALDNPGSSYLWVGQHHHLNREEVTELIAVLQQWIDTGSLLEETNDQP